MTFWRVNTESFFVVKVVKHKYIKPTYCRLVPAYKISTMWKNTDHKSSVPSIGSYGPDAIFTYEHKFVWYKVGKLIQWIVFSTPTTMYITQLITVCVILTKLVIEFELVHSETLWKWNEYNFNIQMFEAESRRLNQITIPSIYCLLTVFDHS